MTLLERLRTATAESHTNIEANPVLSRLLAADLTRAEYKKSVERYYGYFAPLEELLASCEEWTQRVPHFASRLRSARLKADLETLGLSDQEISALPLCSQFPPLSNYGSFLGTLYVLEGSNLGGRLIAKHLGTFAFAQSAHSFFSSDPAATSTNWKSFLALLNEPVSETESLSALQNATMTFTSLDLWMRGDMSGARPHSELGR